MSSADDDDLQLIAATAATHSPTVGRLRLRTLVALRWLAIIGQASAVLIVYGVFGYDLPLAECLAAIAASAWLNISLAFALPSQRLVRQWEAAAQLVFDILQLAFLLSLTGGIENPFSLLFVAPATIAAATLQPRWTLSIIIVTLLCVGILTLVAEPLPWSPAGGFALPDLYRFGLASAIAIGLLFTAVYSWRVSVEEARLADALIATQAILAREQRMAALGGLAAAAAHELGTPLATIQLTSKELSRSLPPGPDQEDAALINSQAERCREILRNLTAHRNHSDPTMDQLPLGQLLEEAGERHKGNSLKALLFDISSPPDEPELMLRRMPEALYGLGNLIENALEFAKTKVTVAADWDHRRVRVTVIDDGPGFDPDILPRLGEPYVTSRGEGTIGSENHEGLGLGFFIAKTLLERTGARVSFRNQASPEKGAVVRVEWSRIDIAARKSG